MNNTVLVNFHCHSIFSDGEQSPEALAANLASAGVQYAALTDHDSLEGLSRFQEALKKRGVASLPGVELTTWFEDREIHLLAYGFDPYNPDLEATLLSLRQAHVSEVLSIAVSLRKMGSNTRLSSRRKGDGQSAAPTGRLEMVRAIDLVHRAGGRTFLAHPQVYESDPGKLEAFVLRLTAMGLDGIETPVEPPPEFSRTDLEQFARNQGILICGGTDFHFQNGKDGQAIGIEISRQDWIAFRTAIFTSPALSTESPATGSIPSSFPASRINPAGKPHHFRRRAYILRIFLPTLIAIGLFLAAIWGILLPSFEQTLLERKREMILELTNSAWSILASYEREVQAGLLSQEDAQEMAASRIEALRYGPEGKDYFWIQDMHPRMIMHPYRSDLNGQDLSDFTDARGVPIFVEFAELVRREGEGYIDYVWQWNDDPDRLEPKQSYVRGFEPWGWVIGTGIYVDDVNLEIARIERGFINASLVISGAVVLLLLFVLQQSLRIERQRQEVLDDLHESTERYHALVETTSEGMLLIIDGRCRYANPTFVGMTGHSARQMEYIELEDLLPRLAENQPIWQCFESAREEQTASADACKGFLQHADGSLVECVLGLNPIRYTGQQGFILLARDITRPDILLAEDGIARAATPGEISRYTDRLPLLVKALLESGVRPRHVTGMLASTCDDITRRLLHLAIQEIGPPPVDFAFIAMGSQGRQEQTLVTDQDNGIIYSLPTEADPNEVQEYFLLLGRHICDGLQLAGYTLCRGGVMASNPRWCRSISDWIAGFENWIHTSEAQEIINLSISFDLRTIYGNASLTSELLRAVHAALNNTPAVFHHLAQNAMQFKSPFHVVGNIYLSGGATEHSGEINLKDAMMPIVAFARLYALSHQVDQTHTLERVEVLGERNVILTSSRDEIVAAYEFLMQLRLQTQVSAVQAGRPLSNLIHPDALGSIQQELLKQTFAQIAAIQKKISYDFLGGM